MAAICSDGKGRKRIIFTMPDGSRRPIRLGKISRADAAVIAGHIEGLAAAARRNLPPTPSTAAWLSGVQDELRAKLVGAGLCDALAHSTLAAFVDAYILSRNADTRTSTQTWYAATRRDIVGALGENRSLRSITAGDADDLRLYMIKNGLGENTVRRRLGICRQFFKAAMRKGLVEKNPFADVAVTVQANVGRFHFISRADAAAMLSACTSQEWRVIVSLVRFGGLRCPSEVLCLRWGDVDFESGKLTVRQPKMETRGKPMRAVPLFPELRTELEAAFTEYGAEGVYVVPSYRGGETNLRTTFGRIVRRAGLVEWEKPFQNMRSTRETELCELFPAHVVCAWIGNSEPVAAKHYLQVTSDHFREAAGMKKAARQAARQDSVMECDGVLQESDESDEKINPAENAGIPEENEVINQIQYETHCAGRESKAMPDSAEKLQTSPTGGAQSGAQGLETLIAAWPTLSAETRARILKMVNLRGR